MELKIKLKRGVSCVDLIDEKDHVHRKFIKTAFLKRFTVNDLFEYLKDKK